MKAVCRTCLRAVWDDGESLWHINGAIDQEHPALLLWPQDLERINKDADAV